MRLSLVKLLFSYSYSCFHFLSSSPFLHLQNALAELPAKVPKAYSMSPPNTQWSGATHGILALPWATVERWERGGFLGGRAVRACATERCCCWEHLSGLALAWVAAVDAGTSAASFGSNVARRSDRVEEEKEGEGGLSGGASLVAAGDVPPLKDSRCVLPVTWKLHGEATSSGVQSRKGNQERKKLARRAKAKKERNINPGSRRLLLLEEDEGRDETHRGHSPRSRSHSRQPHRKRLLVQESIHGPHTAFAAEAAAALRADGKYDNFSSVHWMPPAQQLLAKMAAEKRSRRRNHDRVAKLQAQMQADRDNDRTHRKQRHIDDDAR